MVAITIPEGAHHLDLRGANKEDPPSVIKARNYYEATFRKWINEFELNEKKRREQFKKIYKSGNKDTNEIWPYLHESKLPKTPSKSPKPDLAAIERRITGRGHSKSHSNLGMFYPRVIMQGGIHES